MHGNRSLLGIALGKIIALKQACQCIARGQLDHIGSRHLVAPFGVVTDFRLFAIQNKACLIQVSLSVDFNLFARKRRTGHVATRRVTDSGREITDQENDGVAQILQLTQFIQHNRVTDMNIRSCGVQTELATQRRSRRLRASQLLLKIRFNQKRVNAALNGCHGFLDLFGHRIFLFSFAHRFFTKKIT